MPLELVFLGQSRYFSSECKKDQRRSYPKGEGGVGGVSFL